MTKWYINFRTQTGHTSVHWVDAKDILRAIQVAAEEYSKLHGIQFAGAVASITDAGIHPG